MKILVAEDDPSLRRALVSILQKNRCCVVLMMFSVPHIRATPRYVQKISVGTTAYVYWLNPTKPVCTSLKQ